MSEEQTVDERIATLRERIRTADTQAERSEAILDSSILTTTATRPPTSASNASND